MSTATRFPISSLLICVGIGLLGAALPVVVGLLADTSTHAEGGLNGLFTVLGLFAAVVTGPLAFTIALVVVLLRFRRASKAGE